MNIICEKKELVKGIQTVSKAVSAKASASIQECILIEAGEKIRLTGNDLELGIEMEIFGSVWEEGAIAVNAKLFSALARKLPEGEVTLESTGEKELQIRSGKLKYKLAIQSAEPYSRIPKVEKENGIFISEFALKEAIRQTIFSVADGDTNKLMTGELFDISGKNMKVVSLDGHRISVRNIQLGNSYEANKVVVPGKTLMEVSRIIGGAPDKMVQIFLSKNHILFEMEGVTAVSRLIEGEYFDIDRLFSPDYETKFRLPRKNLEECIDRAGILQNREHRKPVVLKITRDSLELKLVTPLGSMDEKIPIVTEGKELEIGFNPQFLLDMVRAIDDEMIEIQMKNAKMPCIVQDKEKSYLYLILPMNIDKAA